MVWLFCRRCAGLFRSPVIVALCPYCQGERTLDGSTGTGRTNPDSTDRPRVGGLSF